MTRRYYDEEFAPDLLRALKKREILGRANLVHYVALDYNIGSMAEDIEAKFQKERRTNYVLETTPPEAWLAAEIIPEIQDIRPNADVSEDILSEALKRYLRTSAKKAPLAATGDDTEEQKLNTTLEPYMDGLKKLFGDLMCRTKSLRSILNLPKDAYTIRQAMRPLKPISSREEIFLEGISAKWTNEKIAVRLDAAGLKPRNATSGKSYKDMLLNNSQLFYSIKSGIKKKYVHSGTPSEASGTSTTKAQR